MLDNKIDLLDHGFCRLVDSMGGDLSVVRSARVSYNEEWRAGEDTGSDKKLINYLYRHKHMTPFESVVFTFDIKAPIFVFRQWHRHRTWAYNELSARYRELPAEFYVPKAEQIGVQSKTSKQARTFDENNKVDNATREFQLGMLKDQCNDSFVTYKFLLENGWPKELARSVLPVNTYSHMFATVSLRNVLAFLDLRCHEHAQYEIRVYAEAMLQLIEPIVPEVVAVWKKVREEETAKKPSGKSSQKGKPKFTEEDLQKIRRLNREGFHYKKIALMMEPTRHPLSIFRKLQEMGCVTSRKDKTYTDTFGVEDILNMVWFDRVVCIAGIYYLDKQRITRNDLASRTNKQLIAEYQPTFRFPKDWVNVVEMSHV